MLGSPHRLALLALVAASALVPVPASAVAGSPFAGSPRVAVAGAVATRCDGVRLIAHRGRVGWPAGRGPVEDSRRSMLAALSGPTHADASESDWRFDHDGVAFEMHDPTVDRTTDGSGAVAALSTPGFGRCGCATGSGCRPSPSACARS